MCTYKWVTERTKEMLYDVQGIMGIHERLDEDQDRWFLGGKSHSGLVTRASELDMCVGGIVIAVACEAGEKVRCWHKRRDGRAVCSVFVVAWLLRFSFAVPAAAYV